MRKGIAIVAAALCLAVGVGASTFSLYQSAVNVSGGTISARSYTVSNITGTGTGFKPVGKQTIENGNYVTYGFFLTQSGDENKYTVEVDARGLNGLTPSVLVGTTEYTSYIQTGDTYTFKINDYFDYYTSATYLFKTKFTNASGAAISVDSLEVKVSTISEAKPVYTEYNFYFNAVTGGFGNYPFTYIDFEWSDTDKTTSVITDNAGNKFENLVTFDTFVKNGITFNYLNNVNLAFSSESVYSLVVYLPNYANPAVNTALTNSLCYFDYEAANASGTMDSLWDYTYFLTNTGTNTLSDANGYFNKVLINAYQNDNISVNKDNVEGNATFQTTGNFNFTQSTANGDINVIVDGSVNFQKSTVNGDTNVESSGSFETNNQMNFNGDVNVKSNGDVIFRNNTYVQNNLTIDCSGALQFTNQLQVDGNVEIKNCSSININNNVTIAGDLIINSSGNIATSGTLTVGGRVIFVGDSINVSSNTTFKSTVKNSNIASFYLSGTNDVTFENTASASTMFISSTDGDVQLGAWSTSGTYNDVIVSAPNGLANVYYITANNSFKVTAGSGLTLRNVKLKGTSDVYLTQYTGAITLDLTGSTITNTLNIHLDKQYMTLDSDGTYHIPYLTSQDAIYNVTSGTGTTLVESDGSGFYINLVRGWNAKPVLNVNFIVE